MRNISKYIVMILMTMNMLYANAKVLEAEKLTELKKMNKVLQDPVLSIKGAIERPESYVLKLEAKSPQGSQKIIAYLNKKTSTLYIGSAYDKEGNAILFPTDAALVKEGIAFSYGNGSKEIYLITDPECPYCSKFEQAANGKLDEYTVHVILYPLSFHKNSPAMIEWIMAGKDDPQKRERFEEVMVKGSRAYKKLIKDEKKPFEYSAQTKSYLKKSQIAARELNMRGTPALYDAAFQPISQDQVLKSSQK